MKPLERTTLPGLWRFWLCMVDDTLCVGTLSAHSTQPRFAIACMPTVDQGVFGLTQMAYRFHAGGLRDKFLRLAQVAYVMPQTVAVECEQMRAGYTDYVSYACPYKVPPIYRAYLDAPRPARVRKASEVWWDNGHWHKRTNASAQAERIEWAAALPKLPTECMHYYERKRTTDEILDDLMGE
jgi:hypothetical protein